MNPNTLIALVIPLVLVASAVTWVAALARMRSGKPLVSRRARRPVPWGLVDLAIAFVLLVVLQSVTQNVLASTMEVAPGTKLANMQPEQQVAALLSGMAASVATVAISLAILMLRTRARWSDVGVEIRETARDVKIAVLAFLMIAPPVYFLQWGLTQRYKSAHPFIEMLKENPDGRLFALIGVSAVVVAPLAEEYLFRLLLQGWLEKIALLRGDVAAMLMGGKSSRPEPLDESPNDESVSRANESDDPAGGGQPCSSPRAPFWPVWISAGLFAGMHWDHGPDPIPLFVLAVGLGYLYRQTHRILPCVVVHALLNACSTAILWFAIYFDLA